MTKNERKRYDYIKDVFNGASKTDLITVADDEPEESISIGEYSKEDLDAILSNDSYLREEFESLGDNIMISKNVIKISDVEEFCKIGKGCQLHEDIIAEPFTEEEYYETHEYMPVTLEELEEATNCNREEFLSKPIGHGYDKDETLDSWLKDSISRMNEEWLPNDYWDDTLEYYNEVVSEELNALNHEIDEINRSLPFSARPWIPYDGDDDGYIRRLYFDREGITYSIKFGTIGDDHDRSPDGVKYIYGMTNDRQAYRDKRLSQAQDKVISRVGRQMWQNHPYQEIEELGKKFHDNCIRAIKERISGGEYINLAGGALNKAVDELYREFNPSASRKGYFVKKKDIKAMIQDNNK